MPQYSQDEMFMWCARRYIFQINKALNFIILEEFWGIVWWCLKSILCWRVVDIWCVRILKILTKRQRFVQLVAKTHAVVTRATWMHSFSRYLPCGCTKSVSIEQVPNIVHIRRMLLKVRFACKIWVITWCDTSNFWQWSRCTTHMVSSTWEVRFKDSSHEFVHFFG